MIRLAVRAPGELAELVLVELLELAPAGLEECELADGRVEYAIYGAPGELPALPELRAVAGGGLVEVATSEVADDWAERWRAFHRPVFVTAPPRAGSQVVARPAAAPSALCVRPPWEPASERPDCLEIVIDPGQAFGTGAHQTTRGCLELLLALAAERIPDGPLVDLGTGSGVLAIAAAKLGFAPVLALDNDPLCIAAAQENARRAGVELALRRWDLRRGQAGELAPAGGNGVLVANLLRPLLLDLLQLLKDFQRPPRSLIISGLLDSEADAVAEAFTAALGCVERLRSRGGEWVAIWLECD